MNDFVLNIKTKLENTSSTPLGGILRLVIFAKYLQR